MTVSSTTTRNSYTGNGSTTVFAYGFKIFDDDDITVILRTTATGAETVQTKTTHYSVSGVGSASGGNITFGTAPTSAQTVVLLRQTAQTQTTDYTPNDPFPASSHEDALDKLTLLAQDQQDELDRAIKLSRTNTMTSTEFTVGATDRASKILAFDSSGELAVTQELGTFKGNWAASTAYALRDLVKDTSTGNIFIVTTAHTSSGSQPLTTNANSAKYTLLVDASSATASQTAAANSATAAAASATAAAASETAAANATADVTLARNYATKTDGTVETSPDRYSAEAHAVGGTGVTSVVGSAREWAIGGGSSPNATTAVDSGGEFSAKGYAVGSLNRGSSGAHSAKDWATYTSGTVDGSLFSAKYYAEQAAASFDSLDDKYLGSKSSDPTVDNDGNTLIDGALYYDTTNNKLKVYDLGNTQWIAIESGATAGFAIAMAIAL